MLLMLMICKSLMEWNDSEMLHIPKHKSFTKVFAF